MDDFFLGLFGLVVAVVVWAFVLVTATRKLERDWGDPE